MEAPLEGIRIVEIANYVAAPSAGALLADLGAEVIKVEVPQGEIYRQTRPRHMGHKVDFDGSPAFQMDNRGKRSLALDLGSPDARAALLRVIDGCDVVLTNLLPERQTRYGLDPETLRKRQPGLIYASLTGYGGRGAEANRPGFDYAAYWARTGFMDSTREPDAPPAYLRPGTGDHAAGMSLVAGILAALRVRDRTGKGQDVDVSLLQIGLYIQGNDLSMTLITGKSPKRHDRNTPVNPLWNQYPVKGGRWLFLVMIESDRYWHELCRALERPELAAEERFADAPKRFRANRELVAILDEVFLSRTLEEWEAILERYSLIWSPMRELSELLDDPQARAMGYFHSVDHPVLGKFETMGPPFQMSDFELRAHQPAPELGADGESVLREAGLSENEIRTALPASSDDA
ncbi:MAG: CoA transferase [Myxococcota bacterium]|nr:CoA transferase [Myxococcota bacterium]